MNDEDLLDPPNTAPEEDFSLPRATVAKLIQEMLPKEISASRKSVDLLCDCCVEFIHLISSEANEICDKEAKKMISGEHVIEALKSLGFEAFVDEITEAHQEHLKQLKDREKRSFKLATTGMTEEELIKSQELLFAAARARLEQNPASPTCLSASLAPESTTLATGTATQVPIEQKTDSSKHPIDTAQNKDANPPIEQSSAPTVVTNRTTDASTSQQQLSPSLPRKSISVLDLIQDQD